MAANLVGRSGFRILIADDNEASRRLERGDHKIVEARDGREALQAARDALTGLANRRSVETHLDSRISRGISFAVIHLDLNGFN